MEAVFALGASLVRQIQALEDCETRATSMRNTCSALAVSLQSATNTVTMLFAQRRSLNGGSSHLSNVIVKRGLEGTKNAINDVNDAVPYLKANINMLEKNIAEARTIADNAKNINVPLTKAISSPRAQLKNEDGRPFLQEDVRILLIAFNTTMAQLDSYMNTI